jgi:hypothetical protein
VVIGRLLLAGSLLGCLPATAAAQEPRPVEEEARRKLQERRPRPDRLRALPVDPAQAGPGAVAPAAQPGAAADDRPPIETFARDSVIDALLRLEGFLATEYVGAGVRFDRDTGELILEGRAEVVREGQRMTADSLLVYDADRAVVCGYGNPVLTEPGASPVLSDQVCFNIERQIGVAMGARTQFTEGATWNVHGEQVYTVGTERLYGVNTDFTSCELEVPHYHFTASEFKYVHGDLMVARNVTLSFGDVPVFWLPFMVQSMKQGRRSGLLTPRFGANDIARNNPGYQRRISNLGFYWAASDYTGAQVALDWFSDNWTGLATDFQYNWRRQFLAGSVSLVNYWREGGNEFTLATSHRWMPDERSQANANLNYASSSSFIRRNTFDPRELARTLDSNAGYSRRLDWGSLSVSGRRRQSLTDDRVDLSAPVVSLNLSPMTLYSGSASGGGLPDASWQGSLSLTPSSVTYPAGAALPRARNTSGWAGTLQSSLGFGRLSLSQQLQTQEDVLHAREAIDTVAALPREVSQRYGWSTSLGYMQRLVGTSTFTPSVNVSGQARRDPESWDLVSAPTRADLRGTLKLDVFGFWPGAGPFSRVRHMLTPNIIYTFAPAVTADERQQRLFGVSDARERNRIEIGLSQVFEAKYRERDTTVVAAADQGGGAGVADAGTDEAGARPDGEPRRLPQTRKIQLLAIGASAVAYDFVQARQTGTGLATPAINYNVRSDLVQGLNVSLTQDLFRPDPLAPTDVAARTFDPRITQVNASFSLNERFVLFRLLGGLLGRDPEVDRQLPVDEIPDTAATAPAHGSREPGALNLGAGALAASSRGPVDGRVGSFNASFSYSLSRPRPLGTSTFGPAPNQMLRANSSFQPTENWSVQWSTGYSFTDNQFQDHMLTLTRNLDCWQANFNFMRAQNGNFSFQFFVELRANRDLKLEYQQRGQPALPGS